MSCSHKFVDTGYCVKCGDTLEAIKAAGYDEAMELLRQLRAELDAAQPVLEACGALPEKQLRRVLLGHPFRASHVLRLFVKAELDRREKADTASRTDLQGLDSHTL